MNNATNSINARRRNVAKHSREIEPADSVTSLVRQYLIFPSQMLNKYMTRNVCYNFFKKNKSCIRKLPDRNGIDV